MPERQQISQSKNPEYSFQRQTIFSKQTHESDSAAIIQRAKINPKSLTSSDVLQLQRTIGNRTVGRLLSEVRNPLVVQQVPIQRQKLEEEEPCPSCVQRQGIFKEESLQSKRSETIQRLEPEKDKKIQMKSVVQTQEMPEEEESIQGKMVGTIQRQEFPEKEHIQIKKENNTGMPDNLKTGVESLSGIDMSDVRVHYNSSKPAAVGALGYTQGTNIHLAPGHERYLPHEAWHVVQQKERRVQPMIKMKGFGVNDDERLEREADLMGAEAFKMNKSSNETKDLPCHMYSSCSLNSNSNTQTKPTAYKVIQFGKRKKRQRVGRQSKRGNQANPFNGERHIALFRGIHYYKKDQPTSGKGSVEWSDEEFRMDIQQSWIGMPTMSDFAILTLKTLMKELKPLAPTSSSSSSTSDSRMESDSSEDINKLVDKIPDYPLRLIASFCSMPQEEGKSDQRLLLDELTKTVSSWLATQTQEVQRWWNDVTKRTTLRNALIERYVNNKKAFLTEIVGQRVESGQPSDYSTKHRFLIQVVESASTLETGPHEDIVRRARFLKASPFISTSSDVSTPVRYARGKKESGAVRGKDEGDYQGRVLIYIIPKNYLEHTNQQIINIAAEQEADTLSIPQIMKNQKEYTFLGNIPSEFLRGEVLISKKQSKKKNMQRVKEMAVTLLSQADGETALATSTSSTSRD